MHHALQDSSEWYNSPSFLLSNANGLSGRGHADSVVVAAGTREPAQDGFALGSLRAVLEEALPMASQKCTSKMLRVSRALTDHS